MKTNSIERARVVTLTRMAQKEMDEEITLDDALNDFLNDGWTIDYDLYGNYCFIKRHEMFSDTKIYIKANSEEYIIYVWDETNKKESNAIIGYKRKRCYCNNACAKR